MLHDEPIWCGGIVVGSVTSGTFGHTLGCSVGQGYVSSKHPDWAKKLKDGPVEVEISGSRFAATISLRPFA